MTDYEEAQNRFCSPYEYLADKNVDLHETKEKCLIESTCANFFKSDKGNYYKCKDSATVLNSLHGSTLYRKGKLLPNFMSVAVIKSL